MITFEEFARMDEAYASPGIGDKKAVELVKHFTGEALKEKPGTEFPACAKFVESPAAFHDYIELYDEVEGAKQGRSVIHEYSVKLRDYILDRIPDKKTMDTVEHYGVDAIKKFNEKYRR